MPHSRQQLVEEQLEILGDLEELLEEKDSEFSVVDILNTIYDEEEQEDYQKLVMMIDTGTEMLTQGDLDLLTDAWNHFPHRTLEGKCPAEIMDFKES